VADFNLSKILGEDHSASQEVTNPRWLAPEVLQVRNFSFVFKFRFFCFFLFCFLGLGSMREWLMGENCKSLAPGSCTQGCMHALTQIHARAWLLRGCCWQFCVALCCWLLVGMRRF
jgi:hypothetical protein